MPIVEALGWIAITFGSNMALKPGHMLEDFNNHWAIEVDRGESCWTRVSGIEGAYGSPEDFTLDLLCNYRLHKETVTKDVSTWTIKRR